MENNKDYRGRCLWIGAPKVGSKEEKLLPALRSWLLELTVVKGAVRRKYPMINLKQNDCWDWLGYKNSTGRRQYGRVRYRYKFYLVHRFVFQKVLKKRIKKGLVLDHLCKNTICCNPFHMEPVTNKENILRGDGPCAINSRKTHCNRGHFLGVDSKILNVTTGKMQRKCFVCSKRPRIKKSDVEKTIAEKKREWAG